MAKLLGINISTAIVPYVTDDEFATHYAKYGNGGWREVPSIVHRDMITDKRLEVGMAVYVTDVKKLYILESISTTEKEFIPAMGDDGGPVYDEEGHQVFTDKERYKRNWLEFSSGISEVNWGDIGGTLSEQTDLKDALDGKQDTISDLEDIRTNAEAGAGAATTIAGYGDIVTHNASEFATPGDIPTKTSDLENDSGFITADYHDNTKQDVLTAGENITITTGEDGTVTISATDTDTTYTQGTGITIDTSDNNKISVTDYNTIVSNASAGASAATTIAEYGDIVTHNANEFATPSDIPTNTSDLTNDSGFITKEVNDLTNYTTTDDLNTALSGKQDTLTAGENISIEEDESGNLVISAQTGGGDASEITYHNDTYSTVEAALDHLLYVDPKITSISGGSTNETGSTVTSVTIKWTVNKEVTSMSIDQGIGSITPVKGKRTYEYVYNGNITSSKTFTVTISDGKKTASSSITVSFVTYKYCGVSTKETLTDADIRALEVRDNSSNITVDTTHDFNADGKYLYYCLPTNKIPTKGISFALAAKGSSFNTASGNYYIIPKTDFVNGAGKNIPLTIYKFKKDPDGNPVKFGGIINFKVAANA